MHKNKKATQKKPLYNNEIKLHVVCNKALLDEPYLTLQDIPTPLLEQIPIWPHIDIRQSKLPMYFPFKSFLNEF